MDFWNDQIRAACEVSQSTKELGDVAVCGLKIARRSLGDGKKISMISGPVTTGGFSDETKNLLVLSKCIEIARREGLVVFDQFAYQPYIDAIVNRSSRTPDEARAMRDEFYNRILRPDLVGAVYFLPTWRTSTGTMWCRWKVYYLGTVELKEYPDPYYREALEMAGIE